MPSPISLASVGYLGGGGGPITLVMPGAKPETIIKTVVRTVYVDRPSPFQIPATEANGGIVMVDGLPITPEVAGVVSGFRQGMRGNRGERI